MRFRPSVFYRALILDILVLALLTLYRFNFPLPDSSRFIFSGDFVRPITVESATSYYMYPFVLNEHGTVVDPTFMQRIPYWSPFILVSHLTSISVAYLLLVIVTQILSGLLISVSTRSLLSQKEGIWYYAIPLIPSIFALLSYPINYRPYWLYLPLLPGLLQCVLIISYRTLTSQELGVRTKLLLLLMGYLASLQVHVIAFIIAIFSSVFLITILMEKERLSIVKGYLKIAFWLSLPLLSFVIPILMANIGEQSLSPSYVYSYTVLKSMSSKANFVNAFAFSIGFWEKVPYSSLDKLITLLIVSLVVVLSPSQKKRPFFLSIWLIFALSISFELGIANPIYESLADPSNPLAWILRDPFKISLVSLGLFTTVFAFALSHFSANAGARARNALIVVFLALIILSVIVWSPTAKMSQIIQQSTIPREYFTAVDYLNKNTEGPLVFLPIDGKSYLWADNPFLQGSFLARSYQSSYIDYTTTTSKQVKELLMYSTSAKNLKALSLVASGVVIDTSMEGYGSSFDSMAEHLLTNYDGSMLKFGDHLYFLPSDEYRRFRVLEEPLYLVADTDYEYLGSFSQFLNGSRALVFLDSLDPLRNSQLVRVSSSLAEPAVGWSTGYTHDPMHGYWQYYLEKRDIRNWQSDYGEGLVFTWATSRLMENPSPNNSDLLGLWTFTSMTDLDHWKNYTRENQFGALYSLRLDDSTLEAELWNSTWGWKTLNSPMISARYGNWYRWQFQVKAENAYKMHAKIVEYNDERKIVSARQVKSMGSGTFGWSTITFDYAPESPQTRYIQLQIWHGHETTQPLPNRIWIDNINAYDLQRYVEPITLETLFTIKETDDYAFLVRCFQNQQGGNIRIQLDDRTYTIETKNQLNKFEWKEIDTLRLETGQHKIRLTNMEGFNAVNLFATIPDQEYQERSIRLEQILQGKDAVYVLEAASDLYHLDTTISNNDDEDASGRVLTLSQYSRAWQNITLAATGNYGLAVRSKGPLIVQIDNRTYTTDSTVLSWNYLNTAYFDKGVHEIQVRTLNQSEVDAILLCSTQESEQLEDLFSPEQDSAEIIDCRKIDPTKYTIKINATRPFMLSFAEAYNSQWIASVNGERVKSVLLYSATNGFWINQVGQLDITVEYEPQRWFFYGSIISVTILLICLTYLICDYSRSRAVWKQIKATLGRRTTTRSRGEDKEKQI